MIGQVTERNSKAFRVIGISMIVLTLAIFVAVLKFSLWPLEYGMMSFIVPVSTCALVFGRAANVWWKALVLLAWFSALSMPFLNWFAIGDGNTPKIIGLVVIIIAGLAIYLPAKGTAPVPD